MPFNLSTLIKILAGACLLIFIAILSALFTILFIPHTEEIVKVPDVIGKDFETAFDILSSHKLRVKKTPRFSSKVPSGYVLNQNPSPGVRVKVGRQVEIFVSQGRVHIIVPDLKGLTVNDAKDVLARWGESLGKGGLKVGYLAYTHSEEVKEGHVLAQSPLPMSEVVRGTPINLLVSHGPRPKSFEMPNLVGMSLEDALEKTKALGLVIKQIEESADSRMPQDVVISQTPLDGYRVKKGDPVNLVVSRGVDEEIDPEGTKYETVRFTVPDGLSTKHVQIVVVDQNGEREIYNNLETPGHILEIPVGFVGDGQILIYVDGNLVEQRDL